MADFESRLREAGELLPGPASAATRAAERAVVAAVRRPRAPRPRRLVRLAAVVAAALVAGLGGGFALGASRGEERTPAARVQVRPSPLNASFAPGFLPAAGWTSFQSGRASRERPAFAVATNLSVDPRRALSLSPFPADGIVIRVELTPRGQDPATDARYRPLPAPLTLARASRSGSALGLWTLFAQVNGWNVRVEVRFGSARPTPGLVQQADRELARLIVPAQCPASAQPLAAADLGGARAAALAAARHGVERAGGVTLDYSDARVSRVEIGGFADYVRARCGQAFVARTAAVSVVHPHVAQLSASLSQETFLVSKTERGWVVWAQVH